MFNCISYMVPEAEEDADEVEARMMPPWWVCVYVNEWQESTGEASRPVERINMSEMFRWAVYCRLRDEFPDISTLIVGLGQSDGQTVVTCQIGPFVTVSTVAEHQLTPDTGQQYAEEVIKQIR